MRRRIDPFHSDLMPRFDISPHQGEALRVCELLNLRYNPDTHRRITRAYQIIKDSGVTLTEISTDGMIHLDVQSQDKPDQSYRVRFNKRSSFCDCQDWHRHDMADAAAGIPFSLYHCKHLIGAKMAYAFNRCKRANPMKNFGVEYRCTAQGIEVIEKPKPLPTDELTLKEIEAILDRRFGKGKWIGKCYRGRPSWTVYVRVSDNWREDKRTLTGYYRTRNGGYKMTLSEVRR